MVSSKGYTARALLIAPFLSLASATPTAVFSLQARFSPATTIANSPPLESRAGAANLSSVVNGNVSSNSTNGLSTTDGSNSASDATASPADNPSLAGLQDSSSVPVAVNNTLDITGATPLPGGSWANSSLPNGTHVTIGTDIHTIDHANSTTTLSDGSIEYYNATNLEVFNVTNTPLPDGSTISVKTGTKDTVLESGSLRSGSSPATVFTNGNEIQDSVSGTEIYHTARNGTVISETSEAGEDIYDGSAPPPTGLFPAGATLSLTSCACNCTYTSFACCDLLASASDATNTTTQQQLYVHEPPSYNLGPATPPNATACCDLSTGSWLCGPWADDHGACLSTANASFNTCAPEPVRSWNNTKVPSQGGERSHHSPAQLGAQHAAGSRNASASPPWLGESPQTGFPPPLESESESE